MKLRNSDDIAIRCGNVPWKRKTERVEAASENTAETEEGLTPCVCRRLYMYGVDYHPNINC